MPSPRALDSCAASVASMVASMFARAVALVDGSLDAAACRKRCFEDVGGEDEGGRDAFSKYRC